MRKCASLIATLGLALGPLSAAPHYTITDLGTLGGVNSFTWDINDAGEIVGRASLLILHPTLSVTAMAR